MDEIIDWIASITSLSVKTIQGKLNDWTLTVSLIENSYLLENLPIFISLNE
jgi:hypothetical protein